MLIKIGVIVRFQLRKTKFQFLISLSGRSEHMSESSGYPSSIEIYMVEKRTPAHKCGAILTSYITYLNREWWIL